MSLRLSRGCVAVLLVVCLHGDLLMTAALYEAGALAGGRLVGEPAVWGVTPSGSAVLLLLSVVFVVLVSVRKLGGTPEYIALFVLLGSLTTHVLSALYLVW